jgi:hypothetical protein
MITAYEIITAWHEESTELCRSWEIEHGFVFKKLKAKATKDVLKTVLKLMENEEKFNNEEIEGRIARGKDNRALIQILGLEDM